MPDVVMPRLSDSMEEGTIVRWLKADGEAVARGDELVEIETDKATMTYEADSDGVLEIVAAEGETLPIGGVIARIGGAAAASAPAEREASASEARASRRAAGAAVPGSTGAFGRPPSVGPPPPAAPAAAPVPPPAAAPDPAPAPTAAAPPAAAAPAPAATPPPAPAEFPAPAAPAAAPAPAGEGNGRVKASPVARRMARERGLDLRALTGSGPGGRIVKADIEAVEAGGPLPPAAPAAPPAAPAAPSPAPAVPPPVTAVAQVATAKGEVTVQELTRAQQVVARRMASSKATVPDFSVTVEVDMGRAVDLRAQLKAIGGDGPLPSFNDMVVAACARALREHPRANGAYRDGLWELYSRVNVGVAVATPDSLVVPTVFDADTKSLRQIAGETRALAERVRAGVITPPEVSGGTFTVSNLGMFGVHSFTAVINTPQAAILAVGAVRAAPVVRDGALAAGHLMPMTLVCDHRILYGADAARFLWRVRELLEHPAALAV